MDIEDEKFMQYFGRPRNLRKDPDGPQNAQGGTNNSGGNALPNGCVAEIDNPELMYMQTNDNFYKKTND
jgi:hypothetical protein